MRLSRGLWIGWTAAAGLAVAVPGGAQTEAEPAVPAAAPATAPAPGSLDTGQLALSMRDAVALGIENNLDVEVERYDPPISDLQHTAAWGAYDPSFFASYEHSSTHTPIASALQASTELIERDITGDAGIQGLLPKLGWQYDIRYSGQSVKTNSSISSLSPEYRATILGSATLPLLKGFLWGEPWTQVKLSGIASDVALEIFRQRLMDTVSEIENAYWNLGARLEEREVALKSRETSNALLEQTNAQYEVGVVSRVEVTESEAGLADREFRLIRAENAYRRAQDRLIQLVLGTHPTPTSDLEIVPTDEPSDYRVFEVDPEESTRRAFEHRPELSVARFNEDQQAIQLKFAKNQRLPQLDLRATYGQQGLAGALNPNRIIFGGGGTTQPILVGRRYSNTDDSFFTGDASEQWAAGAVLTIPIGNVTGRANVNASELELRKARVQTVRLEQDIVLQVRDAVRDLRSALEGIEAAERRREAAEEQLRAERIRLEHGESTPFEVLQREEDLVDAESQKIGALQAYHNSATRLDRAQGTILRDRNIVVEEARALR